MIRVGNRVQMRAVQRAADIAGGIERLAMYLQTPPALVWGWMQGSSEIPATAFLKVVDIVVDYDASHLRGAIPPSAAAVFKHQRAANG